MRIHLRARVLVLALWAACSFQAVYGGKLSDRKEPADWSQTVRKVDWAGIEGVIKGNKVSETKSLGQAGGGTYKEVPEQGAVLIGFDCIMTPYDNSPAVVRGIAPIFLTKEGVKTGSIHGAEKGQQTIKPFIAKPGYAVGKVTGRFDGRAMRQIKIRFDKIAGSALDSRDTYETTWIGKYDKSHLTEEAVSTAGTIPVGISGTSGWGLDSLQLVFQSP